MKRFFILITLFLFTSFVYPETNAVVEIKDAAGATKNAAATSYTDVNDKTVYGSGSVRKWDNLDFGTTSGGTEDGNYLVGREQCATPYESLEFSVEGSQAVSFKVEFSSVSAANASGYLIGIDHSGNEFPIGTWSSVNTDVEDQDGIETLEGTATNTHGTAFFLDETKGLRGIKVYVTSNIGSSQWVSVWAAKS